MTGHDTRHDQIVEAINTRWRAGIFGVPAHAHQLADAVMPILDAAVAEARAETAETIAQAIEAHAMAMGAYGQTGVPSVAVGDVLAIARQHGEDQP